MGFLRRLIGSVSAPPASARVLPAIPVPPPAPQLPERPRRSPTTEYANERCPYCGEVMSPLPKAKTRCKMCRQAVFVRTGPDGLRYLLQEVDLSAMEAEWSGALGREQNEREQAEEAYRKLLIEEGWRLTFEAMPGARLIDLTDDDEDGMGLEVHGESHHQEALALVANLAGGDVLRRAVVAVLVPDPRNEYDRNAVRVEVFGRLVGYVPRDEAPPVSRMLLALQKEGIGVAGEAQIIGGGRGHSGQWLNFGISLLIADYSDWPGIFGHEVKVRTGD